MSIKKLRFEEHRDAKVQHLSGGMKRKLSLGLALCGHPNVVILGEYTNCTVFCSFAIVHTRWLALSSASYHA